MARSAQDALDHCKEGDYWIVIDRNERWDSDRAVKGSRKKYKFRNVPSKKQQEHFSGMNLIVSEYPCRCQNCVSDFFGTITLFLENE